MMGALLMLSALPVYASAGNPYTVTDKISAKDFIGYISLVEPMRFPKRYGKDKDTNFYTLNNQYSKIYDSISPLSNILNKTYYED